VNCGQPTIAGHINGVSLSILRRLRLGRREAIASHSRQAVIVPGRDCARVLPGCGPGRPGSLARPAAGGPTGLLGRVHEAPPLGASRPLRLSSYPARPPAAGDTTNGHLPWPGQYSTSIGLTTHGRTGPVRPAGPAAGPETAADRQPLGVDARLCVGGVVIRSCSVRKFAFLLLSS
jgi:hypothetical protein